MDLSHLNEEDHADLRVIVEQLREVVADIVGCPLDINVILHAHHDEGTQCNGVAVLASEDMQIGQTYAMTKQATAMLERYMMDRADTVALSTPIPAHKLN